MPVPDGTTAAAAADTLLPQESVAPGTTTSPELLYELGDLLRGQKRPLAALDAYRRALAIEPSFIDALVMAGIIEYDHGRFESSLDHFLRVVAIQPGPIEQLRPHFDYDDENLVLLRSAVASSLHMLTAKLGSEAVTRAAARIRAEVQSKEAGNLMDDEASIAASSGIITTKQLGGGSGGGVDSAAAAAAPLEGVLPWIGASAPTIHVKTLFDDYAKTYDVDMMQNLQYRGPQLLYRAVRALLKRDQQRPRRGDDGATSFGGDGSGGASSPLRVLDLGCGTGLAGILFRRIASWLGGVDASAGMLEHAREREVYDELHEADLLSPSPFPIAAPVDLAVAADVCCYIGDLRALFRNALAALRPGGRWAFTAEALLDNDSGGNDDVGGSGPGYRLADSGRFKHRLDYLTGLAAEFRLHKRVAQQVTLRTEADEAVTGWLLVLEKPSRQEQ